MNNRELAQLQLLASIDELVERLTDWSDTPVPWQPARAARALTRRLLDRIDRLRLRIESPLVVAVFGGSGTGKSTLINALVGHECTTSGRQRPTTKQPIVVTTPDLDLESLGIPTDDVETVRVESPVLKDIVLIDCPDPDTTETEIEPDQLDRLRRILPLCDVLLCTSTQQKYRSARVGEVLAAAATGCRVFFVQTHAHIDEDIRDDWGRQLAEQFDSPEILLIDSENALQQQQAGRRVGGDFARLEHLLTSRLAASARLQIRRANLVDLLEDGLASCRAEFDAAWPAIEAVEEALKQQRERLVGVLAARLAEELDASRYLWERRLVEGVTSDWGFSPFSGLLRLGQGLGGLLTSASLLRARSSAQLALLGAWQGGRWLTSRSQRRDADERFERVADLGIDDAALHESQLVISGFAESAGMDPDLVQVQAVEKLRQDAASIQQGFLDDARSRIDTVIETQARRSRGWPIRLLYEFLLTAFVGFLLYRIGHNFFYDTLINGQPFLPLEFYLPATAFLLLWAALLVMAFTSRLRRGLQQAIAELADNLAHHRITGGLFSELEDGCRATIRSRERLVSLHEDLGRIRANLASAETADDVIQAP